MPEYVVGRMVPLSEAPGAPLVFTPLARPPSPWRRTFPTRDGYYWFWDGVALAEHGTVVLAKVMDTTYTVCGQETIFGVEDFLGYASEVTPPPTTQGDAHG